ncbi:hypothetical protein [Plesiocystis pacifica]|nr:hypothetical protein [Plesiocystis pacifica]
MASTTSTPRTRRLALASLALASLAALAWYALGQRPPHASASVAEPAEGEDSGRESSSDPRPRASDPAGLGALASAPTLESPPSPAPPKPPRALTPREREIADGLGALLDDELSTRAFVDRNFDASATHVHDWLDENLEFLRPRIGECGEPEPIIAGSEQTRLLYPCGDATVEAAFFMEEDGDKLRHIVLGGRDLEPNAAVTEAAELVLSLIVEWQRERFLEGFTEAFEEDETRDFFASVRAERGRCTLGSVDLASPQGALWFIECEDGPGLLKVSLDDDDRIRKLLIRDRRNIRLDP